MFILLRRIERWLHQHIFKVGWLLTQNYQTTTIFYYTIFLPGVVLHELVYWLAAGMLNVRADRAIKWPEAQEVGELKLNFVRINPKASVLRKAIISIAPLLVGLVIIWYIAANIFDITAVFRQMSSGNLRDVAIAFGMLLGAPLFWLWIYIIFTVANTMYPSVPKDLQGWRSVLISLSAVAFVLLILGLGGEIFEAMQSPVSELIFVLQATFGLMIAIDVLMVLVLGLIEYTIESVTGNSATFRGGKMITISRAEALEEQRKQREAELKEQAKRRNPAADTGLKSIYSLAFSIPGIPPQEPLTLLREHSQASIEMPAVVVEEVEEKKPAAMPLFGGIAATAADAPKPISEEQKQDRAAIAARINIPERLGAKPEDIMPAASTEAASEEKRQSASVAKLGTAETEQTEAEEKPVASRLGGFSKPAVTAPKEDDEESEEKPVASRFGGFSKPAISTPKEDVEDSEEAAEEEKPVASRLGGFNKPAVTAPKEDEEDSEAEEEEEEEKPVTSRFGGLNKPGITTPKDDDEDSEVEEKPSTPTTSRFSGFSKSSSESPTPSTSRFGASPFKPIGEGDKTEKPAATTGRFASTEFRRVDAEDEEEEKKPVSRFGASPFGTSKSAPKSPGKQDDAEDEEEKPVSRFGASPFGTSKPAPKTSPKKGEDVEDEDDEEVSRPSSPILGRPSAFGTSRPAPKSFGREDDDEGVDEDEEVSRPSSPILGRPSAFGTSRPAPKSFGREDEDEGDDEDEESAPRSRVSGFGLLGKRPKDDDIVYEDDDEDSRSYDDDEDYVDSDDD